MGYNTKYTASISGPDYQMQKFEADAKGSGRFGSYGLHLGFWFDSNAWDDMSWYDWKDDCIALSLEYPNLLFELQGEGENSGDIWKAWIRNGVYVKVPGEITFRSVNFDEELPLIDDKELAKKELVDEYNTLIKKASEVMSLIAALD